MELGLATSAHGLQTTNVQKFINTDKSHFDVILAEQFFQESFLMFAHKYNAPIVTLSEFHKMISIVSRKYTNNLFEKHFLFCSIKTLTDVQTLWTALWAC